MSYKKIIAPFALSLASVLFSMPVTAQAATVLDDTQEQQEFAHQALDDLQAQAANYTETPTQHLDASTSEITVDTAIVSATTPEPVVVPDPVVTVTTPAAAASTSTSTKEVQSYSYAVPDTQFNSLREKYVAYALSYQGVPYVWGGSSPNGWDCSGFTSYVANQIGRPIPRTSQGQGSLPQVSAQDAQPGDLIIFSHGGPTESYHVGIYLGNGMMIHAPKPGDVTKIAPIGHMGSNITYHTLWAK